MYWPSASGAGLQEKYTLTKPSNFRTHGAWANSFIQSTTADCVGSKILPSLTHLIIVSPYQGDALCGTVNSMMAAGASALRGIIPGRSLPKTNDVRLWIARYLRWRLHF